MFPLSSLAGGSLAGLMNLQGAAAAPARTAAAGSEDSAPTGFRPSPVDSGLGVATVPAMLSQVLSALRASFSISATPSPSATALTPAENADQSFTSALAQAVQAGDGSASSLDAVRNTVLNALNDVSQFLLGMGAAPADVNAAGDALQTRLQSLMSGLGAGGGVAAQSTLVQKEKMTLEIRTAEGDIVKLTLRARSATTASFAAGSAADGSATAGVANVTTINSTRLSVDVEGNINAAEAAAIGDVLRQVEALADRFFAGDVTQAFASAAALHIDSAQLASVALRLRFSESFSAAAVAQSAPPAPATPAPAAPAPASTPADTSAVAPPVASADPTAGTPAPTASELPPASTPAPAATPAPTIESILQGFLSKLLDFAFAGTGDQNTTYSAHFRLQLVMAATRSIALTQPAADSASTSAAASSAATPTADPATAVAKLGAVVDSLGSKLV